MSMMGLVDLVGLVGLVELLRFVGSVVCDWSAWLGGSDGMVGVQSLAISWYFLDIILNLEILSNKSIVFHEPK